MDKTLTLEKAKKAVRQTEAVQERETILKAEGSTEQHPHQRRRREREAHCGLAGN